MSQVDWMYSTHTYTHAMCAIHLPETLAELSRQGMCVCVCMCAVHLPETLAGLMSRYVRVCVCAVS